jgi:hypothetical protein
MKNTCGPLILEATRASLGLHIHSPCAGTGVGVAPSLSPFCLRQMNELFRRASGPASQYSGDFMLLTVMYPGLEHIGSVVLEDTINQLVSSSISRLMLRCYSHLSSFS